MGGSRGSRDATVSTSQTVNRLVEELTRLPGIGPKSAQRLAYHLLRVPEEARHLAEAILSLKDETRLCSVCFNVTDVDPCAICQDEKRDRAKLLVVEHPQDILPVERTGVYRGLYHVLHGAIAPTEGIGPDHLKTREFLARLKDGAVTEVILATNPTIEGEQTALYLSRLIALPGIKVTRLARGLPYGSELEYADDMTIIGAIEGRREV